MKLIVLDTETSDIKDAEIGQLTYLMIGDETRCFNEWFALDYVSEGASAINGLTVETLKELSKGQVFSDVAERVYEDFKGALVVCHNVGFDLPLLDAHVYKAIGKRLSIYKSFCTMEYYTPILQIPGYYGYKWPRLNEVTDYLSIDEKQLMFAAQKIFKGAGIGFHDARFDVATTYRILQETITRWNGSPITTTKAFIHAVDELA